MVGKAGTEDKAILYVGEICRDGYEALTQTCESIVCNDGTLDCHVTLYLATYGGDPHAGFRMARALQHHFKQGFTVVVPNLCKSAGTMIAIGAREVVIADRGELGPLDIQLNKSTELFERTSGLDLPQAIDALRMQVLQTFKQSLIDIRMGGKLSTKIAGEIATNITTGIFAPIFAQIDPIRLGEMQRATYIAFEYGKRLAEKAGNLKHNALNSLIASYPSHGFVIDRKEARKLFDKVRAPNPQEQTIINAWGTLIADRIDKAPTPICIPLPPNAQEKENEQLADGPNADVSAADGASASTPRSRSRPAAGGSRPRKGKGNGRDSVSQ